MLQLELPKQTLDYRLFIRQPASERDYASLIDESCVLIRDGSPQIIYLELDAFGENGDELAAALETLTGFSQGWRTNGVKGKRLIFGHMPRRTLRKDVCSIASMADKHPAVHALLCEYAGRVSEHYLKLNPAKYQEHQQQSEARIKSDYRIGKNKVFSSGIVNKDNPIPYHLDRGNFRGVWSCMLVFKRDVIGGYLSVPEYNVGFGLRNNSLLMFDGQSLLHGVTPILKMSRYAYRYSVVYYTLQNLWHCLPVDEELARIQQVRTERERKRAAQAKENVDDQHG